LFVKSVVQVKPDKQPSPATAFFNLQLAKLHIGSGLANSQARIIFERMYGKYRLFWRITCFPIKQIWAGRWKIIWVKGLARRSQ
jgi:hypothetical protein